AVLVSDDAVRLAEAADCLDELEDVCPQRFAAPLAPYIAARAEGKQIDEDLLLQGIEVWSDRCDIVLVEGAGGLMSPITDQVYNATLAGKLGYPLVIVAPNELGVINQALQTLITAKAVGEDLPVAAVILNNLHEATDPSCQSNLRELKSHCSPVSVYEVARDATELSGVTDWYALAGSC
ncbi:MAG TPA: dethiobiotin synthase, partial [Pirellulales bacterium]|nr:dethiobiotin synthase [Pirellulales bacterium]